MKHSLFFATILLCSLTSCNHPTPDKSNPAIYVTDANKLQMLHSLTDIHNGELYELNYTLDYHLDSCLTADIKTDAELYRFFYRHLMDITPTTSSVTLPQFACSMFAATQTDNSNYLLGRNLDYCHTSNGTVIPTAAILLRTAPQGGKRSIAMVDGLFAGVGKGFKGDGKTDISMLMAAPYLILDGINEDGLAVGVLFLDGNPAYQETPDKKHLWGTTIMRLALDRASTVAQAETLIRQYNFTTRSAAPCNYHFLMADATGDYAIIECSYAPTQTVTTDKPNILHFFRGQDSCYVTNFYVDPRMAKDSIGGLSEHGRARYNTLRDTLQVHSYHLTRAEAMNLLQAVSQTPNPAQPTSYTQWSSLYNLTQRTLQLALLRNYNHLFSFTVQ